MISPTPDAPLVVCAGCEALHAPLQARSLTVHAVPSAESLRQRSVELAPRAIVLGGPAVTDLDWGKTIPRIRESWPLVDIVVWHPRASAGMVRRALQVGVRDVLLGRSSARAAAEIDGIIEAQQLLPRAPADAVPESNQDFEGMLARSRIMWDLFETAAQVAQSNAAVLILGETGTGKELLSRAIHKRSRREGRFVALNCAAVPETLIDSELFGHVEGAFTGATKPKAGLFRHADGGTLLLDEAGNVPLPVQYRLLRVLQEGTVRPVGAHTELPVDVRVIAATSASLEGDVEAGTFREDLFYRLDVLRLVIPPLRDRPDDIIYLFAHFARAFATTYRIRRPDVTDGFLDALVDYRWPGNVRQLEHFTERLVLTESESTVNAERFNELVAFQKPHARTETAPQRTGPRSEGLALDRPMRDALQPHVEDLERAYLEGLLAKHDGRILPTAEAAGVSRRTITRLLKRLGIEKSKWRPD